jgi:nucleotide-binding universal stress UspA family protein
MFERILVPLDGSPVAEQVLDEVRALAEKFGSAVTLMQSVPTLYQLASESISESAPEVGIDVAHAREDTEVTGATTYLDGVRARMTADGVTCSVQVERGAPADAIMRVARELDVSLIAMTTHGRGGLSKIFYGSVAEDVVKQSPVPVLLERIHDDG